MPSPVQVREKMIKELFEAFKGKNTSTIDAIFNKTLDLFPTITEARAKDYARAVLRMLKTKKD